jgi:RIO kinase 1
MSQFADADSDDDDFVAMMQSKISAGGAPAASVAASLPSTAVTTTISKSTKVKVTAVAAAATVTPTPKPAFNAAAPAAVLTAQDLLLAESEAISAEFNEEDDEDEVDPVSGYDDLETTLRNENFSATGNSSHAVLNSKMKMETLETSKTSKHTGRDDRATSEQVLDPRTRLIIFKLLSSGYLSKIDGCLSTGKEANVYYAKGAEGSEELFQEYAVKIYKTSILVFKDRDKYVAGEHRWRKGYCKSNPRKMVKVWAEKEMRNYKRLWEAGIKTPKPLLLKSHVLIMEFLGEQGWPSPRIRDAELSVSRLREAYVQTVTIMRHMFQKANLVHGDLSEYNLLWHQNEVWVIDVSQSVENDHPSALDFLRSDIRNVNDFYRKKGGMQTMNTRQLFEFVTSTVIGDTVEAEMGALDKFMETNEAHEETTAEREQREVDDAVFMSQFIPRSLTQVNEAELKRMEKGEREDDYIKMVALLTGNEEVINKMGGTEGVFFNVGGKNKNKKGEDAEGGALEEGEEEEGESSSEEDSDEEGEEGEDLQPWKAKLSPEERAKLKAEEKAARKANKKEVKGSQAEKRTTKMKKKEKKRAISKTKGKK